MRLLLATASSGLGIGFLITSFGLGLRHGIDWDHIAAITDITSSQETPRAGLYFGSLYAAGHAIVVFTIGVIAIALGDNLPDSVDKAMGRIVGVTLLVLGVYVFYSLIKHGRDFRMRSRWMLVFSGVQRGYSWARDHIRRHEQTEVEHEHEHPAVEPFMHHDPDEETANGGTTRKVSTKSRTHAHGHHHTMPEDPFMNYGRATALGVGMLHGIGGETPTQVIIFTSAAGFGGTGAGIAVLIAFLLGLFVSNSVITLSSAYGYLKASKRFAIYATIAVITGVFSLVIGTLFLIGKDTVLPALLGG